MYQECRLDGSGHTLSKHLLRDAVEFPLELIKKLVNRRSKLSLGIGVLDLFSRCDG